MGAIRVHEFMSLDGVISEPTFTFGVLYVRYDLAA